MQMRAERACSKVLGRFRTAVAAWQCAHSFLGIATCLSREFKLNFTRKRFRFGMMVTRNRSQRVATLQRAVDSCSRVPGADRMSARLCEAVWTSSEVQLQFQGLIDFV
jgi:hypothetical protein